MNAIPTKTHGMIDYSVGAALMASPWVLGFAEGGPETWVPVALGAAGIAYSLITDYELGAAPLIPMEAHRVLDIASGAYLAASPWLLGYADRVWLPHVAVGLAEMIIPLLSRTSPQRRVTGKQARGGVPGDGRHETLLGRLGVLGGIGAG